MALVQAVEDGKFVESTSQSSLEKANASTDGMDKDAFLQLLVAQMKYQDPMQPTSNTEYISQYAQFSQVEQIQNMALSTDLQRASNLVGQQVNIKTVSSTGETNYLQGKVDYVTYEGRKAYVSVDGSLYALDDVESVADKEYLEAYNKAMDFVLSLNKLPNVNGIDLTDGEAIDKLEEIYEGMTDYQKSFIASDKVKDLEAYIAKLEEIRAKADEENPEEPGDVEDPDDTEEPGDTEKPEGEA